MYPQRDLTRFSGHKDALIRDIARNRDKCAVAAVRVARPFMWMERLQSLWRQLSPLAQLAVVPAGVLAARVAFSRKGIFRSVLRWGPLVFAAVRVFGPATNGGAPRRTPVR